MKKVLIAGGTGLIGQAIIKLLDSSKYEIHVLSRTKKQNTAGVNYHQWDTEARTIDKDALRVDAIINLAGAGIADKKWSEARKKVLIESRVNSALTIKEHLEKIAKDERPAHYISASAIGYYGDSGDKIMNEEDLPVDDGFLSICTKTWEEAADRLSTVIPVVAKVRVGIVLSTDGGAFEKMLIPFKFRMASYFGDGSMKMSWIHIDDIARIFIHLMEKRMGGTFNAAAPEVVSNKELSKTIKEVKGGFYILNPVPAPALRIAMGEMADVVLTGTHVSVEKLVKTGFKFRFPRVNEAITDLLK